MWKVTTVVRVLMRFILVNIIYTLCTQLFMIVMIFCGCYLLDSIECLVLVCYFPHQRYKFHRGNVLGRISVLGLRSHFDSKLSCNVM